MRRPPPLGGQICADHLSCYASSLCLSRFRLRRLLNEKLNELPAEPGRRQIKPQSTREFRHSPTERSAPPISFSPTGRTSTSVRPLTAPAPEVLPKRTDVTQKAFRSTLPSRSMERVNRGRSPTHRG